MSLVNLSVKHNRTLDEARERLETVTAEIQRNFAAFIRQTEWSADRQAVRMLGTGFEMSMRIDATEVHVVFDVPLVGKLLGQHVVTKLKNLVQERFQKRLT